MRIKESINEFKRLLGYNCFSTRERLMDMMKRGEVEMWE